MENITTDSGVYQPPAISRPGCDGILNVLCALRLGRKDAITQRLRFVRSRVLHQRRVDCYTDVTVGAVSHNLSTV